jgi:hypothetical protein
MSDPNLTTVEDPKAVCAHEMVRSKIGLVTVYRCKICRNLFSINPDNTFRPYKITVRHP